MSAIFTVNTPIILKTGRLELRYINVKEDLRSILLYLNDAKTMQWIPNTKHKYTAADVVQRFERNKVWYTQGIGLFKIVETSSQRNIGEIGLFPFEANSNTIEIGYILHQDYWNLGYATELLTELEEYINSLKSYTIVIAQLYASNMLSEKLRLKCNYTLQSEELINEGTKKIYIKNLRR